MSHTKAFTAHMRSIHPGQLQEAIVLGNTENASVYWESVSVQFLSCQFQQDASMSCFPNYMQPLLMIRCISFACFVSLLLLIVHN